MGNVLFFYLILNQLKRPVQGFVARDFDTLRLLLSTEGEKREVIAICDNIKSLKFSPVLPIAFTEHGALMAATVLNTELATKSCRGARASEGRSGGAAENDGPGPDFVGVAHACVS